MSRVVRRIVIHCSGGPQTQSAAQIAEWHMRAASKGGRGWNAPGYHYIVEPSGVVAATWPEDRIANGAKGFNADSIHVCYIGGVDSSMRPLDNRTLAQKASLSRVVADIRNRRGRLPVVGHRDLSADLNGDGRIDPHEWIKACPSFDARAEYN